MEAEVAQGARDDVGGKQSRVSPFPGHLAHQVRQRRPLDGWFALVVLGCLTLGGCGAPAEYVSAPDGSRVPDGCRGTGAAECEAGRRRAVRDLGCDASRISARFVDTVPGLVVAEGCGQRALYMDVPGERSLFFVSREALEPPAR